VVRGAYCLLGAESEGDGVLGLVDYWMNGFLAGMVCPQSIHPLIHKNPLIQPSPFRWIVNNLTFFQKGS